MFSVGVCNVLGVCQVSEPTVIVQTGFTRAYDDGLNIYVYTRSSPLSFNDSFGLSTECGGGVTCGCDGGPKNWPVKGDSNRAKLILIGDGCVVLAGSKRNSLHRVMFGYQNLGDSRSRSECADS